MIEHPTRSIEELYQAEHGRLVGLARWTVGSASFAEEIVQEVFVRLVENPPRLDDPDRLHAYVRSAVINRCRSKLRRLGVERRHARAADTDVIDGPATPDQRVRDAVMALPIRQRQCVALRFYDDMAVKQIAETLDISDGAVKTHLHRAMASLDRALDDMTNEPAEGETS